VKILIAEDDSASRRLLETLLSNWQYEVTSCVDGNEAWEALKSDDAPSLVILDWMMPGIDGIEVCRRVRAARASHLTYIIMLTAIDTRDDVIEALSMGADDFLSKPFDRGELRVRLQVGKRILGLQDQLVQQEREARNRAEDLVAERTIELSEANLKLKEQQAQLVHAEKMGAIGQLAAGIAHEINNPVSFITNNISSLKEYVEIFSELIGHCEVLLKKMEGGVGREEIEESVAQIKQFSQRENIPYILSDTTQLIAKSPKKPMSMKVLNRRYELRGMR
jgi:two-component system, NtrC family, sensor kinase